MEGDARADPTEGSRRVKSSHYQIDPRILGVAATQGQSNRGDCEEWGARQLLVAASITNSATQTRRTSECRVRGQVVQSSILLLSLLVHA